MPVLVGEDTGGIDFELLAAGTISGRVISEYGDPLSGHWVDACEYDTESYCNSVETDDDGYFMMGMVEAMPPSLRDLFVSIESRYKIYQKKKLKGGTHG